MSLFLSPATGLVGRSLTLADSRAGGARMFLSGTRSGPQVSHPGQLSGGRSTNVSLRDPIWLAGLSLWPTLGLAEHECLSPGPGLVGRSLTLANSRAGGARMSLSGTRSGRRLGRMSFTVHLFYNAFNNV